MHASSPPRLPASAAPSSGSADASASPASASSLAASFGPTGARLDAISWDTYFMSIAQLSALRSKDPNTRVGACLVDAHRRIASIGYNGFPAGCADDALPWAREAASGSPLDTKDPYVVHSEANAILNAGGSVRGCALYVALFPCCECAKLIIQAGIREVVYHCDKYRDTIPMLAARRMFALAGVACRQFTPPADIHIAFSAAQTA